MNIESNEKYKSRTDVVMKRNAEGNVNVKGEGRLEVPTGSIYNYPRAFYWRGAFNGEPQPPTSCDIKIHTPSTSYMHKQYRQSWPRAGPLAVEGFSELQRRKLYRQTLRQIVPSIHGM